MSSSRRRCQKCGVNRRVTSYAAPNGRVCERCQQTRARTYRRDVRLRETYGITVDEADAILAAQGGGCAICGSSRRYNLDVDHDHRLEAALLAEGRAPVEAARRAVRGLLCRQHNRRLLPAGKDDPSVLRAAADYLEDPPARKVLG